MAVLNAWQRIDRVLTGLPFGNGSAGSATISSDPNTRDTCTGTATSTTLTTVGGKTDVFGFIATSASTFQGFIVGMSI